MRLKANEKAGFSRTLNIISFATTQCATSASRST